MQRKLFLLTLHFALHQAQVVHTSADEAVKIFAEHLIPPPLIYLQLATAQPSGTPSGNIYTRRTINLGFDKDLMLMF